MLDFLERLERELAEKAAAADLAALRATVDAHDGELNRTVPLVGAMSGQLGALEVKEDALEARVGELERTQLTLEDIDARIAAKVGELVTDLLKSMGMDAEVTNENETNAAAACWR
jgi:predicted RNA-binding protein Jag